MSYEVIRLASNLSCLVPLAAYAINFTKSEKRIHIISMVMLLSGVADLITFFKPPGPYVALVFNLQDFMQFSLIALFYYVIESDRKLLSWGVTIYATALIAVTTSLQGLFVYQTLMWTVSGIVIIALSVTYLFHTFTMGSQNNQTARATLLINGGLLFYFSFSLMLFVLGDYILNELPEKTKMIYWSCHNINNIVKNLLIAIGISYSKKA